jgi:hypothetical protein
MAMDELELARERRRQTRLEHLGTNNPICPCCGERDDRCFNGHHLAGKYFDRALLVSACANCHGKANDMQKDHPKMIHNPPSFDERLGHFLLGLADLLELAVEKLREFANDLIDRVRRSSINPPTNCGALS